YDLLDEAERLVFRRLGVFGGSASLEACEAICAGGVVRPKDVLDLLTRLVHQSLVVVDERGSAARYRLLDPVRRFALERLTDPGELGEARVRHASHFLRLTEKLAPRLQGPHRAATMELLDEEHDNLRTAWDHAAEAGDDAALARLARRLFRFWNFGGHFEEGRRRTEDALERIGPTGPADPDLLWASGWTRPAGGI
ncbi:MAG: AfsR/SARP family transcriptional regulator, partial [Acidobacteriota bacterium]